MPYVKPISGHTSCRFVQEYLEKDGRALAIDYIELDEHCLEWSAQMDETREIFDNNKSVNGKATRTYNHYILSPNPIDNITLDELREYATSWARQSFPGFQVAIVYHNDSHERIEAGQEGILHAHLIVNNTNLDTGKRLAPFLTRTHVRDISRLAQTMAKERGWHAFSWEEESSKIKEEVKGCKVGKERERDIKERSHGITKQGSYYTRQEQAVLKERGWSWKEDIRSRVRIALNMSTNDREFVNALKEVGVKVQFTRKGDYLFVHPERDTWKVSGQKLGRMYSKEQILQRLYQQEQAQANKTEQEKRRSTEDRVSTLAAVGSCFAVNSIKTIGWLAPDGSTTLRDVADMLDVMREYNIVRTADYDQVLSHFSNSPDKYAQLEKALDIARAINLRETVKAPEAECAIQTNKQVKSVKAAKARQVKAANLGTRQHVQLQHKHHNLNKRIDRGRER